MLGSRKTPHSSLRHSSRLLLEFSHVSLCSTSQLIYSLLFPPILQPAKENSIEHCPGSVHSTMLDPPLCLITLRYSPFQINTIILSIHEDRSRNEIACFWIIDGDIKCGISNNCFHICHPRSAISERLPRTILAMRSCYSMRACEQIEWRHRPRFSFNFPCTNGCAETMENHEIDRVFLRVLPLLVAAVSRRITSEKSHTFREEQRVDNTKAGI
jgi:hypothetical protein